MKATEAALEAHFTVDKQNVSLWPQELPPGVLRKPLTIRVAAICLLLVLITSVVLQAIFYPWSMGTASDLKTDVQALRGRVDTISALSSDLRKSDGRAEAARAQIRAVNASLSQVRSQILTLKTSLAKADAQIQGLTRSWKEVDDLNAQIPELKRDLDQAGALTAKVLGLQNRLEKVTKLLEGQNEILQMVSQGWRYFRGNFYYFSRVRKTWYSAHQLCLSKDSRLTSVTSEQEQEFLSKTADGLVHWIGLTKAGSEGEWHWVDDSPFDKVQSRRFWIPGEPNNTGNNEHCANIRITSLQSWNDASCDNEFFFICKRPYVLSDS